MKILLTILLLLSLSCQHLVNDGSREYELEDNDSGKTYLLSYNPGGFEPIVEIRRKGAIIVMENKCGKGQYEILSEESNAPGRDASRTFDSVGAVKLLYLTYTCKD